MSFAVVHFLESDALAVASSVWLNSEETVCKWPPVKDSIRLKRLVLEHKEPEASWKSYDVFVMKKKSTYAQAEAKCKQAVDTSNLDTEDSDNEQSLKKRRVMSSVVTNGGSDDEDITKNRMDGFPKPPAVSFISDETNLTGYPEGSQLLPATTLDVALIEAEPTAFQQELLRTMKNIEEVQGEHTVLLKHIFQMLKEKTKTGVDLSIATASMPKTPVETLDELEQLELYLNDALAFSNAVKLCGRKVGSNVSHSTRRLLADLIMNKVAMEFNWAGKKPKMSFKTLKTASLVICAVKENPILQDVPSEDVEHVIKDWLKHARFRENYSKQKIDAIQ